MEQCKVLFEDISLKFGEKNILENFSLCVRGGEKVLISASSGKGKTTLLRLLMGFEKAHVGRIVVNGLELNEKNIDRIREFIGYLPQRIPFRNLRIKKLIEEILAYKKNSSLSRDEKKLRTLLEYLSLDKEILEKEVKELSGGEKQRLGFIVAVLLDREIWVLDEITSSLDQELKEKVIEYINLTDKTVIMVSHDSVEALKKFRRVTL